MIQSKLNYIIALFFIMLIPLTAFAADFNVATSQDLQTALSTANGNGTDDTVYLAAGTYTGNFSYLPTPTEHQALIIKAEDGLNPGQVVLDGDSNGRTLLMNAGSNVANMTVERLTMTNGYGNGSGLYATTAGNITITKCTISNGVSNARDAQGGGGWLHGNDILIQDSIITGNVLTDYSTRGSGLYINSVANLTIDGIIFSNNTSSRGLGGLSVYRITSAATISNSQFMNNITPGSDGSAIWISGVSAGVTVTIDSNIFDNNLSGLSGGALFCAGSAGSSCNVINNTIKNNQARYGAGAYVHGFENVNFSNNTVSNNVGDNDSRQHSAGVNLHATAVLTVNNNIIINNNANGSFGGAGYLSGASTMTVTNNIISGNRAITHSGGLYITPSTLHFINNTVYNNTVSGGNGGGIYTTAGGPGGLHFYNNIIWGNSASGQGDDLYLTGTGSSDKNLHYNSIHDYAGTLFNFASNNIDVDPLFIDSGNDDYHLGAGSLCLDVGLNTAPGIPATDLDGNVRISNTTVDLGAYEHSTGDYHPADINTDWVISAAEFTAYGDSWKTTASPIEIDYVTRAGYLLQNGTPAGTYKNIGGGKPLCWVPEP